MKDSTLWKIINLWDSRLQSAADDPSQTSQSTWSFARNESLVLDFLKTYVGLALREIYLHTVSNDILSCLCTKCPELRFISFTSAFSLMSSKIPSDVDLSILPANIEEIVLSVQRGRKRGRKLARGANVGRFLLEPLLKLQRLTMRDILFDFELFRRVSCCEQLRKLELTDCYDITEDGFILLTSRVPDIDEIRLENCRYGYGAKGASETSKELTGILRSICSKLTHIKKFQLLSNMKIYPLPLDTFLSKLSRFESLRSIGFHGVRGITVVGFQDAVKNLVQLEALEISQSEDVTDGFLQLVARYLQRLQVLQVPVAIKATDEGILAFKNHPCLRKVNFAFCPLVSGQALYDTYVSLPKLQSVTFSSRSNEELVYFADKIRQDLPHVILREV